MNNKSWRWIAAALCAMGVIIAGGLIVAGWSPWRWQGGGGAARIRLSWFVPDGLRADPELFDIYRWAREGKLPNIKRLMDRGSYGYSKPTFPGHTPTNFATLFTGAYPEVHGVNDGPMHVEGARLDVVSVGGFSSAARLVEPVWVTLERELQAEVVLLSLPGSTPPELRHGATIKGRWGNWGMDPHAVTFQDKAGVGAAEIHGRESRLFFTGAELTRYVDKRAASGWTAAPESCSPPLEATLSAWGAEIHAYLHDTSPNGRADYDAVAFSLDKRSFLGTLREKEWTPWFPVPLEWRPPGREVSARIPSRARVKLISLRPDGAFRMHVLFDQLNRTVVEPPDLSDDLRKSVGPLVDFPDSFPPQLVHHPEDKATFLEVAGMSLDWHRDATTFLLSQEQPEVFISDTYTPNQMLTSRWWMGSIDPTSARYGLTSEEDRRELWRDVEWLYGKIDEVVGKLLDHSHSGTTVVLSSDHGAIPLDRTVRLNNFFAREGLLSLEVDDVTGLPSVDWKGTKAVYLQMCHVYLKPSGLAGSWVRGRGPEYEELRDRVKKLILDLEDELGISPAVEVVEWEKAGERLKLRGDRVGDLVLANRPGYHWSEEVTRSLEIFEVPAESGYKQAVLPEKVKGMWTPFMISGPGVRRGHYLGDEPIDAVDQYPTIFRCLGAAVPEFVQGKVVRGVFEEEPTAGESKRSSPTGSARQ